MRCQTVAPQGARPKLNQPASSQAKVRIVTEEMHEEEELEEAVLVD